MSAADTVRDFWRSIHIDRRRKAKIERRFIQQIDAIPYHPQGPEASAIASAIYAQQRQHGGFFDDGTRMECARDALNRLASAGFIVAPIPGHPAHLEPRP